MTDAIITGPGLYVMRNGDFVAIVENRAVYWRDATFMAWDDAGNCVSHLAYPPHPSDIIRRAPPEEAVQFCGGGE